MTERIRLTKPSLGSPEFERIKHVLQSGMLVQGPMVAAFEASVAERVGTAYAVAVSTGTTAIHLALLARGIGPGDEVIVPDFCFPSVANAVLFTGATPVLADVDIHSFNLTVASVERVFSAQTAAILAVHQFGVPCDAPALARHFDCPVIEDTACALGAVDTGGPCGGQTGLGCISFHPRKIITTGEGGMVTTNDAEMCDRLRWLRNHGMERHLGQLRFAGVGHPARMSDIHGAIGVAQMGRLETIIEERAVVAGWYREQLASTSVIEQAEEYWHPGRVYQSLVVLLSSSVNRDNVVSALRSKAIEANVGTWAIHQQPELARHCKFDLDGLAGSALCGRSSITLPLHSGMTPADVARVVAALDEAGRNDV
jgi:dTDP-4-amino-4,6-dideoxygalactose transaminase